MANFILREPLTLTDGTVFDVDPSDISKLIPDTSVKIQLNALPAQKHGELKGKLIYVSADTIDKDVDGNSGNFYRARAQITGNELKDTPPGFKSISISQS